MEELSQGIRELHQRVTELDELMQVDARARDLSERMGLAATVAAEEAARLAVVAHDMVKKIIVIVAIGLVVWTPFVGYGAIWFHEMVRNHCYSPTTMHVPSASMDPWYCGIFPGTGHEGH